MISQIRKRVVILTNENKLDHQLWVRSCEKRVEEVSYKVVDLTSSNWLNEIRESDPQYLLAKPGGFTDRFKQLYDERLSLLVNNGGYKVFPSLDEVLIYENKRFLSFWLRMNSIPHPSTEVFYNRKEAEAFIVKSTYPIVAKFNIGASGRGIRILKSRKEAARYVSKIFTKGITPVIGPTLKKGKLLQRILRKLANPLELRERLQTYATMSKSPQYGFCIFQEYVPHDFEWRVVRIGDSFYAHKKVKKGEMASGSLIKEYVTPPEDLLSFAKSLTDKFGFLSMAIDLFEKEDGTYLVNELQCVFGQSDPYQMKVNGKPGRFVYQSNHWIFEEGMFNTNECFDERLDVVLSLIKNQ